MKTLGELTDEVVAAANAYHELRDDRRWMNLHAAIEAWNKRRAEVKTTQKQKANGSLRNCDIFRDVGSAMVQFMKEKPKYFKPDRGGGMNVEQESETINDIFNEMRSHARDGEFVNGYEVSRLADRIEEANKRNIRNLNDEWSARLRGQGEVMAATARQNLRLRYLLDYCVRFIGDAAEPLGADCETVRMIGEARALLAKGGAK